MEAGGKREVSRRRKTHRASDCKWNSVVIKPTPFLLSHSFSLCTILNYLSQEWQTSKQHLNSQLGETERDMESRKNSEQFNSVWTEESVSVW